MKLEQYFSKLINSSIFEFPYNIQFLRTYENSLFKFRYHSFRILFPIREENRTLSNPSRGNRRIPRSIIRVQRRPKNIFNPLLPLTLCKYKRNLLQINEKIYIPSVEYILVEGFYQEEYFDSTLSKLACIYIYMCKYHALFYHPPSSLSLFTKKEFFECFHICRSKHPCSLIVRNSKSRHIILL